MTSFTLKYHLHFSRVKRLKLQRNQVYYQKQSVLSKADATYNSGVS